jgi:hypothetical protein
MAIAMQIDDGKISQADGQVLLEQARSDAVTQYQQRLNANSRATPSVLVPAIW